MEKHKPEGSNPTESQHLEKSAKPLLTEQRKEELGERILALKPQVRAYVKSRLEKKFPTAVDDVINEVLGTAGIKISQLKDDYALQAWLMRICSSVVVNFVRKRKNDLLFKAINSEGEDDHFYGSNHIEKQSSEINLSKDLLSKELSGIMEQAIMEMQAEDRKALLLYYYEDFTVKEIAAALGLTEGGAKKRLSVARANLRKKLQSIKFKGLIK